MLFPRKFLVFSVKPNEVQSEWIQQQLFLHQHFLTPCPICGEIKYNRDILSKVDTPPCLTDESLNLTTKQKKEQVQQYRMLTAVKCQLDKWKSLPEPVSGFALLLELIEKFGFEKISVDFDLIWEEMLKLNLVRKFQENSHL
jgi:hypothetical protein